MNDEIASIWINTQLDLKTVYRDLANLGRYNPTVKVKLKVDDYQLKNLVKDITVKVNVDDSALNRIKAPIVVADVKINKASLVAQIKDAFNDANVSASITIREREGDRKGFADIKSGLKAVETAVKSNKEGIGSTLVKGATQGIGQALANKAMSVVQSKVNPTAINVNPGDLIKISANKLNDIGRQIAAGLARGTKSESSAIAKVGSDLGQIVTDAAERQLEIKSPSRVFQRLGRNVALGFKLGIDELKYVKIPDLIKSSGADVAANKAIRYAKAVEYSARSQPKNSAESSGQRFINRVVPREYRNQASQNAAKAPELLNKGFGKVEDFIKNPVIERLIFYKFSYDIKGLNDVIDLVFKDVSKGFKFLESKASGSKYFADLLTPLTGGLKNVSLAAIAAGSVLFRFFSAAKYIGYLDQLTQSVIATATAFESLDRQFAATAKNETIGSQSLQKVYDTTTQLSLNRNDAIAGTAQIQLGLRSIISDQRVIDNILRSASQTAKVYGNTPQQQQQIYSQIANLAQQRTIDNHSFNSLSNAIPDAQSVGARTIGVTEQEFAKILSSGQLQTSTFLPAFAQQLETETAPKVTRALDTMANANQRYANSTEALQLSFSNFVLPFEKFKTNTFASFIEQATKVSDLFAVALNGLAAFGVYKLGLSIIRLSGLILTMAKSIPFLSVALAAFGKIAFDIAKNALPILFKMFKEFVLFQVAADALAVVTARLSNASGIIGDFANNSKANLQSYTKALEDARGSTEAFAKSLPETLGQINGKSYLEDSFLGGIIPKNWARTVENFITETNKLSLIHKILPESFKQSRTEKELTQKREAITDAIATSQSRIKSLSEQLQPGTALRELESIDNKLEDIQARRRAIAIVDPNNSTKLDNLRLEEEQLLKKREKYAKPAEILSAGLSRDISGFKNALSEYDRLATEGQITGSEYEERTRDIKLALQNSQTAQSKLNEIIKQGLTPLLQFQRGWEKITQTLEDARSAMENAANVAKTAIANREATGKITSGEAEYQISRNNIGIPTAQLEANRKAILQYYAELNAQGAATVFNRLGVGANTSASTTREFAEKASAYPKEKALLEKYANLKDLEKDTYTLQTTVAEARNALSKQMISLTKSVNDYYKNISRQAQLQAIESEKLSNTIKTTNQQNKLRKALTDGYDNIMTQFLDGIIEQLDAVSQTKNKALDAQTELLNNRFSLQDSLQSGLDLQRTLPGDIPAIPVELDLSSLATDTNLADLNSQISDATFNASDLGSTLEIVNGNFNNNVEAASTMTSKLDDSTNSAANTFNQLGNVTLGIGNSNDALQNLNNEFGVSNTKLADVTANTGFWNKAFRPVEETLVWVGNTFVGISDVIKNLIAQTTNWLSSLTSVGSTIGTIINQPVGETLKQAGSMAGNAAIGLGDAIYNGVGVAKDWIKDRLGMGAKSSGVISPVGNAPITSGFGARRAPVRGASTFHDGIDYGVGIGTNVKAPIAGTISRVFRSTNGGGNVVELTSISDAGKKVVQSFLHLDRALVKVGDQVKQGDAIAKSGDTGIGTGAHLHWRVHIDGKKIDPKQFLKMGVNILGGDKSQQPSLANAIIQQPSPKITPLKQKVEMVRTGKKDGNGLEQLKLNVYDSSGKVAYSTIVNSGLPSNQQFSASGKRTVNSGAPLEYGSYNIGKEIAGDSQAVGKKFIPINPNFKTGTSALGFHVDNDKNVAPGSHGCVVFASQAEFDAFKKAMAQTGAHQLVFDTVTGKTTKSNLNNVPIPQAIANQRSNSGFLDMVKRHEGYNPKAYWDVEQYSIGYGSRAKSPNEVIDKSEAERRLNFELSKARADVLSFVKIKLNQNQLDALTSLTYNAGSISKFPKLVGNLNAGNFQGAAREFLDINKAGGRVLPGLTKRRSEEAQLFLSASTAASQPIQYSSYVNNTPPITTTAPQQVQRFTVRGQAATAPQMQNTVTAAQNIQRQTSSTQAQQSNANLISQTERDQAENDRKLNSILNKYNQGLRDNVAQDLANRRRQTDYKFSQIPNPTTQEKRLYDSTKFRREYDDILADLQKQRTKLDEIIIPGEKALSSGSVNGTPLTPEVRSDIQRGVTESKKQQKTIDANISELQTGFKEWKRTFTANNNRIENLRQQAINFEAIDNQIKLEEEQLKLAEGRASVNNFTTEALQIPARRRDLELRKADLDYDKQSLTIQNQVATTEFNPEQGKKALENLQNSNIARQESIHQIYEQTTATNKLADAQRLLEVGSSQANLSAQVVNARLSHFESQQSRSPFAYDSGTYSALQIARYQSQSIVEKFNLKSQIAEQETLVTAGKKSREEVDKYIASLTKLNDISLSSLRDEINKSIGENQINQLSKVKDNLQTVFDLTRTNSINLSNARADAYLASGGNEFVANASKRRTGRETELQRRDQELRSLDISVLSAKLRGVEIDDDAIARAKSDILAISELNLANLNNQFKTFSGNLTAIAQQGLQGLSSGIADLIVKGGSLTDIFNNLFDTILTGVINSGLNSLIGGLTQGLFAPQQKQSSGGSGLFGFLGNIFGGGGIGSLLGGLFSAGGTIPNYANGGLMEAIATSAIKERQQSGKQPRLIMGHVGELLINADRVKELKNLGVTTQLLLGKANYADGGIVDSEAYPSREYGRGIGTANGRKNELTIHYQSKQIAGENYVTEDQFQQGLRKAAEEGGKRGAQIVTNKLGNSPGYRRSVGL